MILKSQLGLGTSCLHGNFPILQAQQWMAEQTQQFEEVPSCVPGPGTAPFDNGPHFEGCSCKGSDCLTPLRPSDNWLACGCVRERGGAIANGRLRDDILLQARGQAGPVFECGSQCACDPSTCRNRLTQMGALECLQVFPTQRKGRGVRTTRPVPKGTFVCEYVGEVLRGSVAAARCDSLGESDACYLMEFREHFPGSGITLTTHVDAAYKGNVARFINHSCAPNLAVVPVRSSSLVPRLCLFALRDIAEGEELAYHYGQSGGTKAGKPCHCGTKECAGVLPCTR